MTDAHDKPEEPAAEPEQAAKPETPQLRMISEDELKEILATHEAWVKSDGAGEVAKRTQLGCCKHAENTGKYGGRWWD